MHALKYGFSKFCRFWPKCRWFWMFAWLHKYNLYGACSTTWRFVWKSINSLLFVFFFKNSPKIFSLANLASFISWLNYYIKRVLYFNHKGTSYITVAYFHNCISIELAVKLVVRYAAVCHNFNSHLFTIFQFSNLCNNSIWSAFLLWPWVSA